MTALQYPPGYKNRRFLNWFFMGLAYAFLYWARYNLTVAKTSLGLAMTNEDFGLIFGAGTIVYAISFLINGPLTDRHGGRKMMLIAVAGSGFMNLLMGLTIKIVLAGKIPGTVHYGYLTAIFAALYSINMYFQSIGAVAIVHVNASWFHISERGRFGGLFGAMISMGLFFAFDVSTRVLAFANGHGQVGFEPTMWVFFVPSVALFAIFIVELFLLQDTPQIAGYGDIDTGVAKVDTSDGPVPIIQLFKTVFSSRVLVTVAFIGVCTGALRDGIMHWVKIYADAALAKDVVAHVVDSPWMYIKDHWGLQLMIAGIIGPMAGGWARDKIFQSRCAPPAGIFYGILIIATISLRFALHTPYALAAICFFMAIAYIGSQGLLTATAAMDFGGKAKATATGVIDGFVYIGTAVQAVSIGFITTRGTAACDKLDTAAKVACIDTASAQNWPWWPVFLFPFALIGFVLCLRIWHATAHAPAKPVTSAH